MNKRLLLSLLVCASCFVPQKTEAQFFKKLFGGKEEPRKRTTHKPTVTKEPEKTKKNEADLPSSVKKPRYRIDVLLPLYYNELIKNNQQTFKGRTPAKAIAGIHIYQGMKLAADTIDNSVYKIDLHIHDIADDEQLTYEQIVAHKMLDSANLIIGAVQSSQIPALAKFAKKKNVNFVSILSPSDADISNNPFFTLAQPTLSSHCKYLARLIDKGYPKQTISLYHRNNVTSEEVAWQYFKDENWKNVQSVDCNTIPNKEYLSKKFSASGINVLVMPILDPAYAGTLLKQLDEWFPTYTFEVFGMPSWKNMPALNNTDVFKRVAVNFTIPFYYNNNTATGLALENSYSSQFGGKPDEWVYRGYELFSWYADLLMKHGTVFNKKYGDNAASPFTAYDVKQRKDKEGNLLYYENLHVYRLRYEGGRFTAEE